MTDPVRPVDAVQAPEGGDDACWLDRVCPDCGALQEADEPCWRCGRVADG